MMSQIRNKRHSKRYSKLKRPMSEINVTPFVDVMLVLLIVFMITAPLLTTGLNIKLPEANTSVLPGNDTPLILSIDSNRDIFLSNRNVELSDIKNKLSLIYKSNPEIRIFIRADQSISYSVLINVIKEVTNAGLRNISLVTLPEK